ncbi:hypothetical protein [Acinetobacter sp.]|uniref:hypothetical protein n=1 Tax=Acinetobacter sp. TaxID=472 RepID=UPI000C0B0154|nr:hypothetical protein [Acinetobacter sp.]MAK31342.1 hypothetical protein [Acinetobacter sp.]
MATEWSDMLKRGCDLAWVLSIEGIPYVFTEREFQRADSVAPVAPPTYYDVDVPALLISDRDRVSIELDRKSGVSRGDAWDILLAWNALEDAGVLDDLFSRPTAKTALAAIPDGGSDSVLEYKQTTIKVVDNSVFSAGQRVFLGKEAISIGAIDADGTSLTGCTRGLAGYVHQFDSQSLSNYRQVTNRPTAWRGRFVELHAHLVSPEGRFFDSTYLIGDYHRVVWRGYLDSPPVPDMHGMRLRALPLVRLAANDLGFESSATIVNSVPFEGEIKGGSDPNMMSMLIHADGQGSEKMLFQVHYSEDDGSNPAVATFVSNSALASGIHPLGNWVKHSVEGPLKAQLVTALGIATASTSVILKSTGELQFVVFQHPDYLIESITIFPLPGAYWCPQLPMQAAPWKEGATIVFDFQLHTEAPPNGWVAVSPQSGSGLQDVTLPATGLGVIEGQEAREIVRWKAKDETLLADHDIVMLNIAERQVNGTPLVPFAEGGKLVCLSGHAGTTDSIIKTVLQSSGTGQRGSSDTLQYGLGLGVPAAWMDTTALTSSVMGAYPVLAVNPGRSSLEDMVGGWLALFGKCLTQAINESGECVITGVDTQPMATKLGPSITTADVLMESVGTPQVVDTPNEVKIDPSGLDKTATLSVRDVPRIQGEGPRSWELKCPSIDLTVAQGYAQGLIAQGDGQSVISLTVGAWMDVQPGATVRLTIAHPAMYDWGTGARAPASVSARVVGWELSLVSGKQRITLLLSGNALDTRYLCPSPLVASKASNTITMATPGATTWFAEGEKVELYNPGSDSTENETLTIQTLNGATNQITFTGTPASWVGMGTVCTHAIYSQASTDQQLFMYVRSETEWGF